MEELARSSAANSPKMTIQVLQEDDLRAEGMHMIVAVGQAATCPPRLVILEYAGNPANSSDRIALVGKVRCTKRIIDFHIYISICQ